MKVLFDTSVLVATLVEAHPMHERALPWLERVRSDEMALLLSAHSVAELYSILTTLPLRPRISPDTALRLIDEMTDLADEIIALSGDDYRTVVERIASLGLVGGVTYDALISFAAQKGQADRLVTFNGSDFRRVWPDGQDLIIVP